MEAAGGSGVRGRRRRPVKEEERTEGEERGGRKRRRCEGEGGGSWVCQESYCGLTMQDQASLARYSNCYLHPAP